MALRTFGVGPARGLTQAAARDLPNLVVIAGPNGAGKSTLLEELGRQVSAPEPGTSVVWIGPHRGWNQLHTQRSTLWEVSFPDGLVNSLAQFRPGGVEDAGTRFGHLIKNYLISLHARQRNVRDEYYDRLQPTDVLVVGSIPDLFEPLQHPRPVRAVQELGQYPSAAPAVSTSR